MRVFVFTSDKYNWAIRPFSYLFNVYWSSLQDVVVVGFNPPPYPMPQNFTFYSVSKTPYPAKQWSDAVIQFLKDVKDAHFVMLLDDYWLCRTVDCRGVAALHEYILTRPEVMRMDLTADRLYAGGMREVDHWGCYDIVETGHDVHYQMSTQAGIWNRENLLKVLRPGLTPWEVEMHLGEDLKKYPEMRILGSRQWPVRYANVFKGGNPKPINLEQIPEEHLQRIKAWLPKE